MLFFSHADYTTFKHHRVYNMYKKIFSEAQQNASIDILSVPVLLAPLTTRQSPQHSLYFTYDFFPHINLVEKKTQHCSVILFSEAVGLEAMVSFQKHNLD